MKRPRKRRHGGEGRFFKLQYWVATTEAWRHLFAVEKALYIELGLKYNGINNGNIGMGQREAARALRVKPETAARAFEGLRELGFIKLARDSAFSLKTREAREWTLTAFPAGADLKGTLEFARWRPPRKSKTQTRKGAPSDPKGDTRPPLLVPKGDTESKGTVPRNGASTPSDGPDSGYTFSLPGGSETAPTELVVSGAAERASAGNDRFAYLRDAQALDTWASRLAVATGEPLHQVHLKFAAWSTTLNGAGFPSREADHALLVACAEHAETNAPLEAIAMQVEDIARSRREAAA